MILTFIVFSKTNMIVVRTSEAYVYWDKADQQERGVLKLAHDFILPALQ